MKQQPKPPTQDILIVKSARRIRAQHHQGKLEWARVRDEWRRLRWLTKEERTGTV